MRNRLLVLAVSVYLAAPFLLLQGAEDGYTVDANATLELTAAMVDERTPFPEATTKQGPLPAIVHLPGHLWARHAVELLPTAYNYPKQLRWYDRRALMTESGLATGLTTLLLFWGALQFGLSWRGALLIATLFGFTSMALPYARYDYHLPLAGLGVAGWLAGGTMWLRRGQRRALMWAGISLGLLVLVRLELAVLSVGAIAFLLRQDPSETSEATGHNMPTVNTRTLLALTVPFTVGLAGAAICQYANWGKLSGGYEGGFSATPFAGLHGFLFSLGKSVLIYNPVLLLLPWAYLRGLHEARRETLFLMLSTVPAVLLYAWWWNWWGGWGWGPRHLVPLLPLLYFPLVFHLVGPPTRIRTTTRLLAVCGLVGLGVQIAGICISFNNGILYTHKLLQTASPMFQDPVELEAATIHFWPWSGLSIHLQVMLGIPLSSWDIGLLQWASAGPASRGMLVLLLGTVWSVSAWTAWRGPESPSPLDSQENV